MIPCKISTNVTGTPQEICIFSCAGIQPRHHDGSRDQTHRIQAADQRDDHAGNAHALADSLNQTVLYAKDLDRPRQARKAARQYHREELIAFYVAPRVLRRLRTFSDNAQVVTKLRILTHKPVDQHAGKGNEQSDVCARSGNQLGELRRCRDAGRLRIDAACLHDRSMHQICN